MEGIGILFRWQGEFPDLLKPIQDYLVWQFQVEDYDSSQENFTRPASQTNHFFIFGFRGLLDQAWQQVLVQNCALQDGAVPCGPRLREQVFGASTFVLLGDNTLLGELSQRKSLRLDVFLRELVPPVVLAAMHQCTFFSFSYVLTTQV